ncbi:S8 family serine peptidase [Parvibaculum sp.]|jgi:hypothetical protein|uniref:S8 family peptidase n=1 Tax=Parvibaculum sp. TaxID=2024848 RepID=UPI001B2975AD|nr:S8 family serine peptidase [Parvibaculum sp.]MBO6635732.1 S8 family serine peptidase [Parvibaculum sp.]MBO6680364.1 S8 family serine peptidase [Parvibaculum sp.]MBO6685580.1 S8 family serine peptidase [Parvibaculum sp.]
MTNRPIITAAIMVLACQAMPAFAADYEYSSSLQGNLAQIGVTEELHGTVNGEGFGIAVFDSLADYTHVDLQGKTSAYAPYAGSYRFFDFHGTHVSGIAGASDNDIGVVGVAPGSRLYNYAVFDDNGWVAHDLGRRALDAVRTQNLGGANIVSVNMSYGPSTKGDGFIDGELEIFDNYTDDFVIVRAAGNDGRKLRYEPYSGTASTELANLLIVGSVDSNNRLSRFSNRPGGACISVRARCPASERMYNFFVVAPGSDILSDYPGQSLAIASGTSMAAPHVAGVVALVAHDAAQKSTALTPTQIASIIKESATDLGRRGVDAVYGWGLVNAEAALAPVGDVTIETAPTVGATDPAAKQPKATKKKKKKKWGRSRGGGRRAFSQSTIGTGDLLSGMVVFDDYGRPFEANTAAFIGEDSPALSERGLAVLGLVSQRKVADVDTGEHAFLAWNATGLDGKATSALRMVAEGYDLSIGLGAPELFLMEVPSANRAAAPQSFSRIMFSSLGEASELFGEAVSIGYNAKLTDRLTGHVFGLTETGWMDDGDEQGLLEAEPETEGDADFAAAGLSYRVADGWSVGASYAVLRERGTVAGMASSGALSLGEEALTQFWGTNVIGDIDQTFTVSAFYTRAVINSSGTANSLFEDADNWGADHYGVMLDAKNLVHENSVLRFSLVKPLQITSGTTSVRVPVGRELDGTINYVRRNSDFDGSALPLEAGLAYLAETGAGTFGLTLDLVDTNLNGAGERGVTVGAGFAFEF